MKYAVLFALCALLLACQSIKKKSSFTGADEEVRLITLDPGHFHAALIQKTDLRELDKTVHVYAPKGPELDAHLSLISSYNNCLENPTHWKQAVYTGKDYLEKMLSEKKGNVVILAGDNKLKIDYIQRSVEAGINVLADKPVIIEASDFGRLEKIFSVAAGKNVMLYDIMTERFDIIHIISRLLMQDKVLFGELVPGTKDRPCIEMESMHHFFKEVSGKPLIRPAWFYDVEKQGEAIVDVTTHLIDLIHWKCFPEENIDYCRDVEVLDASHWATPISLPEFEKSTGDSVFPSFLRKYIRDDKLYVNANGTISYRINDIYVYIKVGWNFQAPEGAGDVHRTVIRGTHADIDILQGKEEGYKAKLYIKNKQQVDDEEFLKAINRTLLTFSGQLSCQKTSDGRVEVIIPSELKTGHENHFSDVAQQFLGYLIAGQMPEWEIQNLLAKYYITTRALEIAKGKD